ncbi:MAG: hypothetical protein H6741_31485 [Alphaproteobacteria bacterium]|nr:hypothetical protein [Alphaproteobacteria bacterium]
MRTLLIFALAGLTLGGCKKKEPEPAAPAEPVAAPMNPAETVLVQIRGDHAFKNVKAQCKSSPDEVLKGSILNQEATVTGLSGDCTLVFMPGGATFGPVTGGTSWNCIAKEDGSVGCKPL